jgi:hypothetical protein
MPKNDDESSAQIRHRVLDAAQRIVIHEIAGGADHEEVTDVLIEDDFGRSPRISTTDDNGKRMLFLCGFRAAGGDGLARADFALSESLVAGLQATESLIWSDGWSGLDSAAIAQPLRAMAAIKVSLQGFSFIIERETD